MIHKDNLMQKPKIIMIFDWDDTLLNAGKILSLTQTQALREILQKSDQYPFTKSWVAPTEQQLYQQAGHRFKEKILPLVMSEYNPSNPKHQIWSDDVFSRFKHLYSTTKKSLFPGITTMLESLKQCGFTLTIASNKSKDLLESELQCTQTANFFKVVMSGDDPAIKQQVKPHPAMLNHIQNKFGHNAVFCMVGDRPFDMEAAKSSILASQTIRIGIESQKNLCLDSDKNLPSANQITPELIRRIFQKKNIELHRSI